MQQDAALKNKREDNTKMDLQETDEDFVDWIYLAQDRIEQLTLVNTKMHGFVFINPRMSSLAN
jgi:uncharacterized membrane protein YcgQ (UPF0703/DUF1980 family)